MKVAIIAPLVTPIGEPQRGGSQAFVSDLARGLAGRGHEVNVYAASGSEVPGVKVIDTGVDPASLSATLYRAPAAAARGPAARDAAAAETAFASVYANVREIRYDVVHNHAFDAPAIRLATALPAPVVHTLHLPPDEPVAEALRHAAQCAGPPAVACVSAAQANAWRRIVRIEAILPPYVPTRIIPWSARAGAGAVFAGRLSPEKGAAEAIDIAQAAGTGIDVYGDVYDAEYAREQIDPRRGTPGVAVHPGVPRTALWVAMARAAVVVCPARWDEPFGMAAAEAQACGTPVVAFRRGGLGEVIRDGVTGFLVAPDDIQAAADGLRRTAEVSRSACRDHAVSHFDLELSLDAHERLYRRVAGPGGRAAASG
jgi:UDP-glucose:tetrahydrobiopterin glucosyltransferase